jgi:hypothetical protein
MPLRFYFEQVTNMNRLKITIQQFMNEISLNLVEGFNFHTTSMSIVIVIISSPFQIFDFPKAFKLSSTFYSNTRVGIDFEWN